MDTELQVIENNNGTCSPALLDKIVNMGRIMVTFEPIIANVMAIVLGCGILVLLNYPALFPKLGKFHFYLTYVLYGLIVFQTIKSSTKSLLVPLVALVVAGAGFMLLNANPNLQLLGIEWLKKLMLLGVIGIMASIFVIR